uniref:Protein kinase domain-containing protein n=1 Tax=Norrisiella sphaerica TaxID=552664 RepID=A0A7S2QSU6_9EUKA|mmetsp:Transcript_2309/g.3298  ORF Transcript_2309/g.3298 Transcript_2309/m.3298 type:complete len:503 (+) Transcript_2309:180-1688(+)|eukprot:CAMPEP_0184487878 /NCGR_PEP_ID=MMETSP0113_2-20130426/10388_1 /TAXON_ID=91329 /ORGANISM="Norrisiella sphaerica, Strain BC52" /LENGTH=502 /DNA_ID=CAMNT_0026870307 /DNA_START=155 /DNA_END=1663 /DNA_ORIENTATION=+
MSASSCDDKHDEQRRQLELLTGYPGNSADLASLTSLDLRFMEMKQVPEAISKCSNLVKLDVGCNKLTDLPQSLAKLPKLKILFATGNLIETIPKVLKDIKALTMISLMRNSLTRVDCEDLPLGTQWLIMTSNKISEIKNIGRLKKLQKCMLSHNQLKELPPDLKECSSLQMLRAANNKLETIPKEIYEAPRMAWIALSGNPCTSKLAAKAEAKSGEGDIDFDKMSIGSVIGGGSGGKVYEALWMSHDAQPKQQHKKVAVKLFPGGQFSDGTAKDEWMLNKVLPPHANILSSLGSFREPKLGIIFELIEGATAIGGPPSFDTCTRDTSPKDGKALEPQFALKVAMAVCNACRHLHKHNITHGDVYLHNTLRDHAGDVKLSDFGAAFMYPEDLKPYIEGIEVRAFGWLLSDLLQFSSKRMTDLHSQKKAGGAEASKEEKKKEMGEGLGRASTNADQKCCLHSLRRLAKQCTEDGDPSQLPTFEALCKGLTVAALTVVGKHVRNE